MSETFSRSGHRPSNDQEPETWEQAELAPTLNTFENHTETRATVLTFEPRFARNGLGAPTDGPVPSLKDQAGQTGKGDAAPHVLTSSTGASPAKTYPLRESALDSPADVRASGSRSLASCEHCGHAGSSLRMSLDFYPAMKDATSPSSSTRWMSSGSMRRGRYWTHNTSESRNVAAACFLSQVLEQISRDDPRAKRYWLSAKAAAGILRRAERRGKTLPLALREALVETAKAAQ